MWAQYASGVVGGVVLVLAAVQYLRTTEPTGVQRVPALPRSAAAAAATWLALATLFGVACAAAYGVTEHQTFRHTLFLVASWGGGAGLAALLLACAVLRPARRHSK